MGLKISGYAGQRRIFFVLSRATRKFHGDIGLWMQYIEFARRQKAAKKLSEILTSALRLHPTKPELWIYAAKYAVEERNDMVEARTFMQRGLRFCKDSKNLWLQYAKFEMIYVARINLRGRKLGLSKDGLKPDSNSDDKDIITLPPDAASDLDLDSHVINSIDQTILDELTEAPIMTGAIPKAIFDLALKHHANDEVLGGQFFDVIAEFPDVPSTASTLEHILGHITASAPESPTTLFCFIRQPLIGIEVLSSDFPSALGLSLERLNTSLHSTIPSRRSIETTRNRCLLLEKVIEWMLLFFVGNLDHDIHKVLSVTLKQLWGQYSSEIREVTGLGDGHFERLLNKLKKHGLQEIANSPTPLELRS